MGIRSREKYCGDGGREGGREGHGEVKMDSEGKVSISLSEGERSWQRREWEDNVRGDECIESSERIDEKRRVE